MLRLSVGRLSCSVRRRLFPADEGWSRWLREERHLNVDRPFAEVVELLHDLRSLEEFEPRADPRRHRSGDGDNRSPPDPRAARDSPVVGGNRLRTARPGLPLQQHRLPLWERVLCLGCP